MTACSRPFAFCREFRAQNAKQTAPCRPTHHLPSKQGKVLDFARKIPHPLYDSDSEAGSSTQANREHFVFGMG